MQDDQNEPDWEDENEEINLDLWLPALLAMTGDTKQKEEMVQKIAQKTGLVPEKVDLILAETIKFMIHKTRAN